jgi:hypothetical protein
MAERSAIASRRNERELSLAGVEKCVNARPFRLFAVWHREFGRSPAQNCILFSEKLRKNENLMIDNYSWARDSCPIRLLTTWRLQACGDGLRLWGHFAF